MISFLFNKTFDMSTSPTLGTFAKTMFASLLQYHEVMQRDYGINHIVVISLNDCAKMFGITMRELFVLQCTA